eukprot:maker-scaffold_8-snap-gene-12.56-mRNA-1 protein AED:0.13 eAED:0.13 QI:87/1/1/1/1/1/2/245/450
MKRFAIVGSGPAGMYSAKYLNKLYPTSIIDIYEQLPVPYGLIRYGVAPDHPEVKEVEKDFDNIFSNKNVNFFGNIRIGDSNLSLQTLKESYSAVVLAHGANSERRLPFEPENPQDKNIFTSREFVYWYNGHPYFQHLSPKLNEQVKNIAIIGQGNVALDCARMFLCDEETLRKTDITEAAIEMLMQSKERAVNVIGRRGPLQAAFTIKEFRELTRLKESGFGINSEEFDAALEVMSQEEIGALLKKRPKKRIFDLLKKVKQQTAPTPHTKQGFLRFLLSPKEFIIDSETNQIKQTKFIRQTLNSSKAVDTDEELILDSDLVITAVGFLGTPNFGETEDLKFDKHKHVYKNAQGHLNDNLFSCGWAKRGATGIVATNLIDAKETVSSVHQFLESNPDMKLKQDLRDRLSSIDYISFEGYKKIDHEEKHRGLKKNKPREKILSIHEMLDIAL